jgi:hypothetical protein
VSDVLHGLSRQNGADFGGNVLNHYLFDRSENIYHVAGVTPVNQPAWHV